MYDIKFNAKKSLGIKFGSHQVMSEVLYLGNSRIEWVSSVKHLGNHVNSDMTDKTDCDMKCSSFIGYVNKLKANFGYLQPFVLGNLFKTFCCSFYGSPLWGFNSMSFEKTCTTWNIGVRSIFKNKKNKNKNKNKNKFISEQNMKFDDNEILLINILLETHTMGTTAIT